ncbi:MAG TPA: ABC transporter permease [Methylomirabilota bacterium]|nr:ABC transporter permease [Methylomirabilota bacterium]
MADGSSRRLRNGLWRFERQVAIRHLRSGGGQTWLTVSAVAAGVIIVIFITGLIFGLRRDMARVLTEFIAHVTVQVGEVKPVPLERVPGAVSGPSSSRLEQQAPQEKTIDDWPRVIDIIRAVPDVRLAAPVVRRQAFASKGANPLGVTVVGVDPALQEQVAPVTPHLIAGRYQGLTSEEVVVDAELAEDLSVSTGERIRLSSNTGASDSFTVVGIYSRGRGRGEAYVTLRTAQSLFGLGAAVNAIQVKLDDIYQADQAADRIMALVPYEAKSWSREFPRFLDALKVQSAAAYLTSAFSLIASSFAIASILIVSVLQKAKQIGILKAMGARRRQIQTIFIFEGLGVALLGSLAGAIAGTAIIYTLSLIEQPIRRVGQTPEQLFPVAILPLYIGLAMGAAIASTVIAAYLPARRAAALNPVDVMR